MKRHVSDNGGSPARRVHERLFAAQHDVTGPMPGNADIPGMNKIAAPGTAIVGIGASAGGIEALTRFLKAMPADSGMGFVVVLHLDPSHESQLAHVLASSTAMEVVDVADGMPVLPNRVHVIVPDRYLTVRGGALRLSEPTEAHGHRYPVDILFESLAEDQHERAIGIILSGTGTNGTHGLQALKAEGGLVLVQDPATARFDGMPGSAISAGMADQVLAPEEMPAVLLRYLRHGYIADPQALATAPDGAPGLDALLGILHAQSGHAFTGYKPETLVRRVHRRMGLANLDDLGSYTDAVRADPAEQKALARDLMISVTGFFRDPEAWQALDEAVIAPLVALRAADQPIRIWVPCCATGEEAYTVAMLVAERAAAAGKRFDLKIFATDPQDENLNAARSGVYPSAAVEAIPPALLERYFTKLDGSCEVKKELRASVVFAPQNLLRDPPFSRMDLITCRNFLIYLKPEAQGRTLRLFHFALREQAHLLLGSSESVGRLDDLFDIVSKKWRIYRRIGPTRHDIIDFPVHYAADSAARAQAKAAGTAPQPPAGIADLARRALLQRYAPASVLIDRRGRALYFHGQTGPYLEPPPGEPTRDLVAMAREGLRAQLRGAVRQAAAEGQEVVFHARLRRDGAARAVVVTVCPVNAPDGAEGLLLVSFAEQAEPPPADRVADAGGEDGRSLRAVEEELRATRAELSSTIEQMEGANEELKASNEEITSMNEELQSTNEELDTSREELQSYNEELHTINNQLQHKVRELEDATNDLNNLLSGTEIATIFLDSTLRIKWFSETSVELLDLLSADIGRPLSTFALKVADENLLRDAQAVLERLLPIEAEVRSAAGRWYLRRLLPYRTQDHGVDGVVLTFIDITERRAAAEAVNEARVYAEAIVGTIRQPLLVLDGALHVQSANRAFYDTFGVGAPETEGRLVYELGNGQWNIPALRSLLEEVLPRDDRFDDFEVDHVFEAIGRRVMLLDGRRLRRNGGRPGLMLLAIEDVTEQRESDGRQTMLIGELNHRVKNVLATVQSLAVQTLRRSASLDEFGTAFEGRLHALARAHDLLVARNWTGTEMGLLAHRTFDPYRAEGEPQVVLGGPELLLRPQIAVALVMILHELATNSAKYGALSVPDGRLAVTWSLEDRLPKDGGRQAQVRLLWIETGGPRVVKRAHQGFGTRLIERCVVHELAGEAHLDFQPAGLRGTLTFPWDHVRQEGG